jgi:hypothetical protein
VALLLLLAVLLLLLPLPLLLLPLLLLLVALLLLVVALLLLLVALLLLLVALLLLVVALLLLVALLGTEGGLRPGLVLLAGPEVRGKRIERRNMPFLGTRGPRRTKPPPSRRRGASLATPRRRIPAPMDGADTGTVCTPPTTEPTANTGWYGADTGTADDGANTGSADTANADDEPSLKPSADGKKSHNDTTTRRWFPV